MKAKNPAWGKYEHIATSFFSVIPELDKLCPNVFLDPKVAAADGPGGRGIKAGRKGDKSNHIFKCIPYQIIYDGPEEFVFACFVQTFDLSFQLISGFYYAWVEVSIIFNNAPLVDGFWAPLNFFHCRCVCCIEADFFLCCSMCTQGSC